MKMEKVIICLEYLYAKNSARKTKNAKEKKIKDIRAELVENEDEYWKMRGKQIRERKQNIRNTRNENR